MEPELLDEVRRLWRGVDAGVLSTISQEVTGYPFGSLVPYVTTPVGCPVIYVSGIAQHTKNLRAQPQACLTVIQPGDGDKQAGARISLLGDAEPVGPEEREAVASRYYACFPSSRRFAETHDFAFWQLRPKRVRFIGGFGKIHWIEPQAWLHPQPEWAAEEASIVEHMNGDHADALLHLARHHAGDESGEPVTMLALDPGGLHVRCAGGVRYLPFATSCATSAAVREEVVRLTREARAANSGS